MKVGPCIILAALLAASAAHADGVADGNAGLEALNAGDYDRAVGLFTRAIDHGGLAPDDKEFAYANRGRAYLKKGDASAAIVDLDRARRLKPDDADAQNDLVAALSVKLPAAGVPGAPRISAVSAARPSGAQAPGSGILGALIGGALAGIAQGIQDAGAQSQDPN